MKRERRNDVSGGGPEGHPRGRRANVSPSNTRKQSAFELAGRAVRSTSGVLAFAASMAISAGALGQQPARAAADAGAAPAAAAAMSDAGAQPTAAQPSVAPAPLSPLVAPTHRKAAPPPQPPTASQLAAYGELNDVAKAYESGAQEYRDTVTTIVRIHYEAKKKEILSGLDREIAIEKKALKKARETAIRRLEEFIEKYSGENAHPKATPDAMYRLAALYEERARGEDGDEDLSAGLKPAIALYKRVIREFPAYEELAGIYYFLGHAYNDSDRGDEGQQVWRSLVCHNHFSYPTPPDPKDPERDTVRPLPQDNTEEYWTQWRRRYPFPESVKKGGAEVTFENPYPDDCKPVPQPGLHVGEEPKYVAEAWWQIGNWEFDQQDIGGGVVRDEPAAVWDYNRAASAYLQSLKFKKPPLYGVALYKYAWTLFKQQRYSAATEEFVRLLRYTDDQEKLTGDPGADFRGEAYTYIAGSLTNVDFEGPGPSEPFIARPDILDTEPDPDKAEKLLHVAVDRVQDPKVVPQDKPWTIEIYDALAKEFRSINQFHNAIEVYTLMLKRWPMHPTAPETQNAIAETYDQANMGIRPNTPEHDANAAKALAARTALSNYIGTTPWVDANKENPEAIRKAEQLVKGGLRRAAAQHTNNGKQFLVGASQATDAGEQIALLERAQSEYRMAAAGWAGYLHQDDNAPDAYESRYWLADAHHKALRISVLLHKVASDKYPAPTQQQVDAARLAAIAVRDSNEDDKYLDNAAYFVVEESDVGRDIAYQAYDESNGQTGIEKREEVKFDSDGPNKKVVKSPIPKEVLASMQAREDYVARVPASLDVEKRGPEYKMYVADMFFVYGHFDEARKRFEPMYRDNCGKNEYGYRAWEKLISMSNMERDVDRSRKLAEEQKSKSCAVNEEQTAKSELIINPTLQEAAYVRAREKFKQAKAAPEGPEKKKLWKEAAGMYEAALEAAPARDEAPEAAMNAAYAYKQIGAFNKAIELYNKFIAEYGSEERLAVLEKGDPKAKKGPDPQRYKERLGFLGTAYDELGTTYYSFFNYPKAAATYGDVAKNARFDEGRRKEAAKNAVILYANMGQKEKMTAQYRIFRGLNPSAEEQANVEFLVASYDYQQWDPHGSNGGSNGQARQEATQSLMAFYARNREKSAASKYALTAAYRVAKMTQKARDPQYRKWFQSTINAWEKFKSVAPAGKDGKSEAMQPPYSDYPAEAEYTLVDEEIRKSYEGNRHEYNGAVEDVVGKFDPKTGKQLKPGAYQKNADLAQKYDEKLQHIVATYPSPEWVPAAIARQGALFDTLRTGLYDTVPPKLKYFTAQQEAFLKKLENSGREDLEEKADELRTAAKEGWRSKKERELAGADEVMVRRYATAVELARNYGVRGAAVANAVNRLAYFTDIIGNEKLRQYVTATTDPNDPAHQRKLAYTDGMFVQRRPGIASVPAPSGVASPLPVAP